MDWGILKSPAGVTIVIGRVEIAVVVVLVVPISSYPSTSAA